MRFLSISGWVLVAAATLMCACDKPIAVLRKEEPPPVVKVPPVETRPFEEGYAAGFVLGKAEGRPRDSLPNTSDVEVKASEAAGSDPQKAAKWQRGWVSGYMDGFEHSSTGRK